MWQLLERKISFLNCLFVCCLLSAFLVFFTLFVIRIFFTIRIFLSAFSHPHPPSADIRSAFYRHPNLSKHAGETWRKRAVIGHFQFKSVSSYGRTELTRSLQTMSYDWSELFKFIPFYGHVHPSHVGWSELFQICALLWQGWRHMVSTALLRTLENHKERCKNCKFFSFITKSSATAKLRLPSSS